MGIELDDGQSREVTIYGRVVPGRMDDGWKNAVFTAKEQGKHAPVVEQPSMGRQFIELPSQRWGASFPNWLGDHGLACREVHAKVVVEEFHLSAGIKAGAWAIAGPGSVRCRQLIREWHDDNIGRTDGRWKAKKRPLLKVV